MNRITLVLVAVAIGSVVTAWCFVETLYFRAARSMTL
jgi:hypothetical protein